MHWPAVTPLHLLKTHPTPFFVTEHKGLLHQARYLPSGQPAAGRLIEKRGLITERWIAFQVTMLTVATNVAAPKKLRKAAHRIYPHLVDAMAHPTQAY